MIIICYEEDLRLSGKHKPLKEIELTNLWVGLESIQRAKIIVIVRDNKAKVLKSPIGEGKVIKVEGVMELIKRYENDQCI